MRDYEDLPHYIYGPVIVVANPGIAYEVVRLVQPKAPHKFLMWERVTLYGVFRMPSR